MSGGDTPRCGVCNRLTPTAEEWETVRGGERADLCWWGGGCSGPRYDWRAEVERLRAASRALAGIDAATLDAVTPAAMRRVMEARGWRKVADVPLHPGLPAVAWERYERPTRSLTPEVHVLVCEAPDDERRDAVLRWAVVVACRHGDVSPAEVIAEALAAAGGAT